MPTGSASDFAGDGTSGILIYGAQLEAGSTPSSYMPTNGGTYTRTAQSLTVPPAEFGWPEPEYIGPELVVDGAGNWVGDFDVAADLDEWSAGDAAAGLSVASQAIRITNNDNTAAYALSNYFTTVSGKTYTLSFDVAAASDGGRRARVLVVGQTSGTLYDSGFSYAVGSHNITFTANDTSMQVILSNGDNATSAGYFDFDNISVREINPLSVSIQMDGRMTYADDGSTVTAKFVQWEIDADNRIQQTLRTISDDGTIRFLQEDATVTDLLDADDAYSPGILTPFNISSRHGSTFINGAVDGVALTEDTTPTAIPDLSGTNLQIASDFMGTIGTFRQFAGDIGDAGLVTATNPSTEPTLSLTFDGTAGGSFYNLNWSE
jgi:hypothetical protein